MGEKYIEKLTQSRTRCILVGRGASRRPWRVRGLCEARLQRTQSRSRSLGESGSGRNIEDHDRGRQVKNTETWRAVRGYSDGSKKGKRKQRMWNCDQSRRQVNMDHTQQNRGSTESLFGHGHGNCLRSDWSSRLALHHAYC